jgi:hypothetical protein
MKELKRAGLMFVAISLVVATFYATGWTQEMWRNDDPIRDEWNMIELQLESSEQAFLSSPCPLPFPQGV